jgi:hypothetical protein
MQQQFNWKKAAKPYTLKKTRPEGKTRLSGLFSIIKIL